MAAVIAAQLATGSRGSPGTSERAPGTSQRSERGQPSANRDDGSSPDGHTLGCEPLSEARVIGMMAARRCRLDRARRIRNRRRPRRLPSPAPGPGRRDGRQVDHGQRRRQGHGQARHRHAEPRRAGHRPQRRPTRWRRRTRVAAALIAALKAAGVARRRHRHLRPVHLPAVQPLAAIDGHRLPGVQQRHGHRPRHHQAGPVIDAAAARGRRPHHRRWRVVLRRRRRGGDRRGARRGRSPTPASAADEYAAAAGVTVGGGAADQRGLGRAARSRCSPRAAADAPAASGPTPIEPGTQDLVRVR